MNEDQLNKQSTKNINNINYESAKILILEMETESKEKKDTIKITPEGLVGSLRKKKDPNDNYAYFGFKEIGENVIKSYIFNLILIKLFIIQDNNVDYYLPIAITKSIEFKEKTNAANNTGNNNNNNNNNNNLATNSSEKNKNVFFKINYNFEHNLYYLIDMKIGYGTFYKIEERTIIYENSIINIGESYLIFSFNKTNFDRENNLNEDDLFLKIYSSEGEYNPMIIQSCGDKIYKLGRTEKCDVVIRDKMLSRVHCILFFLDNNWYIQDGNEEGNESTNGTWIYALDEIEIKPGMKFKSNSCNFICKFE